jgi:hypothetical protein
MRNCLSRFKLRQTPRRCLNTSHNRQLVPLQNGIVPSTNNPWKQQTDPKGSGLVYWWNPETNETTHLGSLRPRHWVEVQDPVGSSLTYWWDPDTNETTSLGAPRPHHLQPDQSQQPFQPTQPMSFGGHMIHMMGVGFGVTMGFIVIRLVFGF